MKLPRIFRSVRHVEHQAGAIRHSQEIDVDHRSAADTGATLPGAGFDRHWW